MSNKLIVPEQATTKKRTHGDDHDSTDVDSINEMQQPPNVDSDRIPHR